MPCTRTGCSRSLTPRAEAAPGEQRHRSDRRVPCRPTREQEDAARGVSSETPRSWKPRTTASSTPPATSSRRASSRGALSPSARGRWTGRSSRPPPTSTHTRPGAPSAPGPLVHVLPVRSCLRVPSLHPLRGWRLRQTRGGSNHEALRVDRLAAPGAGTPRGVHPRGLDDQGLCEAAPAGRTAAVPGR